MPVRTVLGDRHLRPTLPGPTASWWILTAALGALTVLWSVSTVPMAAPDEPAHVIKAVAVADGQFRTAYAPTKPEPKGVTTPQTSVRVPEAYASLNALPSCWQADPQEPVSCEPEVTNQRSPANDTAAKTYVGAYPPGYYLAVGWPARFLGPRSAIYAMRIVSALAALICFAAGFSSIRRGSRGALPAAGAALALTPAVFFLAGTVNPNGLEIAASFCLWTSLLEAIGSPRDQAGGRLPRRALLQTALAGAALAAVRPLSPLFVVIVILVVAMAVIPSQPARWIRSLAADRMVRLTGALLALSVSAWTAFALANRSFGSLIYYAGLDHRSASRTISDSLDRYGSWTRDAVGLLGWTTLLQTELPSRLSMVWIAVVVIFGALALVVGTLRHRLALGALIAGAALMPLGATLASPGTPWQGRYALPLFVGIPILATWIIDRTDRIPARSARAVCAIVATACGAVLVVAHRRLMYRNLHGITLGPFFPGRHGTWPGPLTPRIIALWAVIASSAYVVGLVGLTARPRPEPNQ